MNSSFFIMRLCVVSVKHDFMGRLEAPRERCLSALFQKIVSMNISGGTYRKGAKLRTHVHAEVPDWSLGA